MTEEQTTPAQISVPQLTPELIAELKEHGGNDLVERWQRLIRALEDIKDNPLGPNKSARQWLADWRGVMEQMSALRDREAADQQSLDDLIEMLRRLEEMLDPQKRAHYLLEKLAERIEELPLDPKGIEESRAVFQNMSDAEKQGILYIRRLIVTDDAFGIVVRGHVLIENALEECICSYVPNPVDLFEDLKMFFAQKLLLANMLGVITSDEYKILKAFNKLRNDVAHSRKKSKNSGFHLTPKRERDLWSAFISNPATNGKWPKYDEAKHPVYLRYMVVHLYLMLNKRSHELQQRRLTPVVTDIRANDPHADIEWVFAPLLVHVMAKAPAFEP